MKKLIGVLLMATLVLNTSVSLAKDGVYDYICEAEKDYVENILDSSWAEHNYDTSVFEGERVYLVEEGFTECSNSRLDSDAMPSGWNIDRRGGMLRSDGEKVLMMDGDSENVVSLEKDILPHKYGDIVLEASMCMKNVYNDGFHYELSGNGKTVLRLETHGRNLCYLSPGGKLIPIAEYQPDVSVGIKAVIHMDSKTIDLTVSDKEISDVKFYSDSELLNKIKISTSKEGEMIVAPEFIHLYVNFIVNERFHRTNKGKTPVDWKMNLDNAAGIGIDEIESQRGNINSLKLTTLSVLDYPCISKDFVTDKKRITVEFFTLIPQKHDGIEYALKNGTDNVITIQSKGEDFVLNNETMLYKEYVTNFWNRFKIILDYETHSADIYLNYNLLIENVPISDTVDCLSFTSGVNKGSEMWLDDVLVYEATDIPQGYPEQPRAVKPKNGLDVGMVMYSMWREGFHFGWDTISPYDERTPYMGYYSEGNAESVDWETKWLLEHGVNFQIYPFCSVNRETPAPLKRLIRGQAILDGFLNSARFPMDFCIMWSNPNSESIIGMEDFENNILPYWVENFFKNKNYKTIDNKILIYTYQTEKIIENLGGKDNFKKALKMIDDAAQKIGYDGAKIVVSIDISDEECKEYGVLKYRYSWADIADSQEAVISYTTNHMENGYGGYILSVPQGYNNTPWRINSVGFMTPDEVDSILKNFSENINRWKEKGNEGADIFTLTCWNEWGEGHFYGPSKLYGFSYMNSVRNRLTDAGVLYDEQLPTEKSYVRMNVMYPLGREFLKIMPDQISAEASSDTVLLKEYDFSNPETFNEITSAEGITNLRVENGVLMGTASAQDSKIRISNVNIDASKISFVKADVWQETASSLRVYFATDIDPEMGKNNKRIAGSTSAEKNLVETILLPAAKSALKGTISDIRIDPDDNLFGDFKIKKIQFWGTKDKNISLRIDGTEYELNTPIRMINGKAYLSAYQYFYTTLKTNTIWNRADGKLHIDYGKYSVDLYDGQTDYYVNGVKKSFSAPSFFEDGNFYVPIREFFEEIGFEVVWNDDFSIDLYSEPYRAAQGAISVDGEYEFNIDGWTDGWQISNNAKRVAVEDGVLKLSLRNTTTMNLKNLELNAADYKYAVIRMKNNSLAKTGRFFFTTDDVEKASSDVAFYFDLSQNDKKYTEYVINLETNENYKGTIRSLRFDLVGNDGSAYIDSIKLIKSI